MRRVVAISNARRKRVVRSRSVGKDVKSRGRSRKRATISTSTEDVIESDNPISKTKVGSGIIRIDKTAITANARPISVPGKKDRHERESQPPLRRVSADWERARVAEAILPRAAAVFSASVPVGPSAGELPEVKKFSPC